MRRGEASLLLSSLSPAEVDKIFEAAMKIAGKPKSKRFTVRNTGRYNAVALPEIPAQILAVKDADAGRSPMACELIGQQVICSRNLKPPVVVEYVSIEDDAEHDAKIAKELERLRPKG